MAYAKCLVTSFQIRKNNKTTKLHVLCGPQNPVFADAVESDTHTHTHLEVPTAVLQAWRSAGGRGLVPGASFGPVA